jgi:hypothetical protein
MPAPACPRAPGFGCMIHNDKDSEKHEVFGANEFKKEPLQQN